MSSRPRSLHRQLLAWLLLPLIVVLAGNAWFGYLAALARANEAYDRLLLASVRAIADRVGVTDGAITVDLPYVALQLFESDIQERIYYRVGTIAGSTITGYDDLPRPPAPSDVDRPQFYRASYNGEPLYLASLARRVYDARVADTVVITVGETSEARIALSQTILASELQRQGVLIAVAALVVWFGLTRGLAPLTRLSESIRRRDATDLTLIDARGVQKEVRPLVDAINGQLARMHKLLLARQRFIADATHQVRTPLAVLKTQVEYGLRQDMPREAHDLLLESHATIEHTARLVTQLLALARAETDAVADLEFGAVDLPALARETALEWIPVARRKHIDLGFEGVDAGLVVHGHRPLLHDLIANLVDNAIRYSPEHAMVTVRVRQDAGGIVLEVEDSGPGIPANERERVFERFYRGREQSTSEGTGLGLAIVRDIATSHRASIQLGSGALGKGLLVTVRFPVATS